MFNIQIVFLSSITCSQYFDYYRSHKRKKWSRRGCQASERTEWCSTTAKATTTPQTLFKTIKGTIHFKPILWYKSKKSSKSLEQEMWFKNGFFSFQIYICCYIPINFSCQPLELRLLDTWYRFKLWTVWGLNKVLHFFVTRKFLLDRKLEKQIYLLVLVCKLFFFLNSCKKNWQQTT